MPKNSSIQINQFKKQFENGRLAQSFLVTGPEGTGKFSAVIEMVGILNDLSTDELQLARRGELADIILLQVEGSGESVNPKKRKQKEKGLDKESTKSKKGVNKKSGTGKVISKKQLDKAIDTIGLKNFQLAKKILIIRNADKLTHTATNSLLKLIEEPQQDLIIFLLVNNEDDVLTTIKSRCQRINFFIQSPIEIKEILRTEFELKDEMLEKIIQLSGGRIDLARDYAKNVKKIDAALRTRDEFRRSLGAGKVEQFKLIDRAMASDEDLLWILNEWIWYLKDFLEQHIRGGGNDVVIKKIYIILNKLMETRGLIKTTNVNKKIQLENFFVQI